VNQPSPSTIDFSTSPEVVRVVAEGERLGFGHLFNPAFSVETALIDPLPHQRIAVYQYLLTQTRLRFLLADDAGAGKTIMAGLYIREMLARRLIRRVLIVPPAGLVGNWESELSKLFGLAFRIVTGGEARASNPFVESRSDRLIVSVDSPTSPSARPTATSWPRPWPACPPTTTAGRWAGPATICSCCRRRRTWARTSPTTPSGGCWSPTPWPAWTPSMPILPTPAAGTSFAAPRRRWCGSTAAASTHAGSRTPSVFLTQGATGCLARYSTR
jgi:hypothetical protein